MSPGKPGCQPSLYVVARTDVELARVSRPTTPSWSMSHSTRSSSNRGQESLSRAARRHSVVPPGLRAGQPDVGLVCSVSQDQLQAGQLGQGRQSCHQASGVGQGSRSSRRQAP
ncbi:hypothetical protein PAPYR_11500 [Paratrimastix pyriformis]|uniref:Uncharacterized protein n=1 Tax=Paratrimastix pyriformis TaxID=342808 RepID=A0ABQ8UAT0_9EUKA|nr:hypothetical protein PAPYR_11500 [Paratrimastix pyriformis]